MSKQDAPTRRIPSPIMGILAPGEKRTRNFPLLPQGIMPLLQNFPGGSVRLVEQSMESVTIENVGAGRAPFTVLFVTMAQVQKLSLIKQTLDGIAQLRRKPK